MNIGKEIKTARELAGLTQEQLAERCGWLGQARVSHLETGRRRLDFKDMVIIEDALELKRGTLYARARGDIDVLSDELPLELKGLTVDQAKALVTRVSQMADLDPQQRMEIARILLDMDQSKDR